MAVRFRPPHASAHTPYWKGGAVTARKVVRKPASASAKGREPSVELGEGHAYIPDMGVYASYVGRDVFGISDMEMLAKAMERDQNILLAGPTGSGKTRVGEAFAALQGVPYYSVPCDVSIDPSALFGKMIPTGTVGEFVWQNGPVAELVISGGVLNLSEINFMSAKISAALFSLLDSRRCLPLLANRGQILRPEPGKLLVIADHNPGYRGTQQLNAAFKNRFPIKITWDYDPQVEAGLVVSASLRDFAQKLRAMAGREIRTPVSTNALMEFETLAGQFNFEFAVNNFLNMFEDMEREAVRNVLTVCETEIKREVCAPVAPVVPACDDCGLAQAECECDDEEFEFTFAEED